jgi:hypothetical protein
MEYDERNISKKMVHSTAFGRKVIRPGGQEVPYEIPSSVPSTKSYRGSQILYLIGKGSTLVSCSIVAEL